MTSLIWALTYDFYFTIVRGFEKCGSTEAGTPKWHDHVFKERSDDYNFSKFSNKHKHVIYMIVSEERVVSI